MALRWYTTVVDANDVASLSRWWAEVLDWEIGYEADDEVVLIPKYARHAVADGLAWDRTPPGLVFVAVEESKPTKNRLHLDLAPHSSDDRDAEIARVVGLGATQVDVGQPDGSSSPPTSRSARSAARRGTSSPTPRATSSASCRRATSDTGPTCPSSGPRR